MKNKEVIEVEIADNGIICRQDGCISVAKEDEEKAFIGKEIMGVVDSWCVGKIRITIEPM